MRAGLLARVAFREADWACGRTPRTGGRGGAVAAGRSDVSWRKRVPPERRGARFLNSACGSAYSAHRSGFEVIDKAAADE
nr:MULTISPECIES: hypothetical protein [unclassified Mycolicibacterium]